jgi:amino acid transporter
MYTGGPKAAFANWTMVGGFSSILSLVLAEIAAALPTAGGIYVSAFSIWFSSYVVCCLPHEQCKIAG